MTSAEHQLELHLSDPAELRGLADWFAASGQARVRRESGVPAPGEQGAADYLTIIGSSTVLVAAIQMLPQYLKSRRAGITVTAKTADKEVTVRAENADEAVKVLERVLEP